MKYNSDEFWDAYNERAAIMEYDGKMVKTEADRVAFKDTVVRCTV